MTLCKFHQMVVIFHFYPDKTAPQISFSKFKRKCVFFTILAWGLLIGFGDRISSIVRLEAYFSCLMYHRENYVRLAGYFALWYLLTSFWKQTSRRLWDSQHLKHTWASNFKWLGTAQPRRFLGKNKSVNFSFRYHVWWYYMPFSPKSRVLAFKMASRGQFFWFGSF